MVKLLKLYLLIELFNNVFEGAKISVEYSTVSVSNLNVGIVVELITSQTRIECSLRIRSNPAASFLKLKNFIFNFVT